MRKTELQKVTVLAQELISRESRKELEPFLFLSYFYHWEANVVLHFLTSLVLTRRAIFPTKPADN